MKKKNERVEYQYLDLEHSKTKQVVHIKIGPCPIAAWSLEPFVKQAFKEQQVKYSKFWIIKKAWYL